MNIGSWFRSERPVALAVRPLPLRRSPATADRESVAAATSSSTIPHSPAVHHAPGAPIVHLLSSGVRVSNPAAANALRRRPLRESNVGNHAGDPIPSSLPRVPLGRTRVLGRSSMENRHLASADRSLTAIQRPAGHRTPPLGLQKLLTKMQRHVDIPKMAANPGDSFGSSPFAERD